MEQVSTPVHIWPQASRYGTNTSPGSAQTRLPCDAAFAPRSVPARHRFHPRCEMTINSPPPPARLRLSIGGVGLLITLMITWILHG